LWVKILNNRFGSNTIQFNNTAVSVTLQDAWLSGFTAEGCFSVAVASDARLRLVML
jgi:L-amino acid N-acyltransferase YncA